MRRLSIAISTLFLLSPISASAAYMTPSALMMAIQNGSPHSFTVMAHADAPHDTYVSIWTSGAIQGTNVMDQQLVAKMTVDIISGDMNIRAKGEIMTVDNMLYIKLSSINGSLKNPFASFAASLQQHKWLKMPIDMTALEIFQNPAFFISSESMADSDSTFNLATTHEKNGATYTLTLKPDSAAQLAFSIRELLQDSSTVSEDFFPWKDLADGLHFSMTVKTDAKDVVTGSSYEIRTQGMKSNLTFSGTEKPTTTLKLKAPTDALDFEEISAMFDSHIPGIFQDSPEDMMMPMNEETPDDVSPSSPSASFDMLDNETPFACDDPSLDPMQKLMMQRVGTCPVMKTPTRYSR